MIQDLLLHPLLLIPLLVALVTQAIKIFFDYYSNPQLQTSNLLKKIISLGGIPSGHAAFVSSITTTSYLLYGPTSAFTVLSMLIGIIIIRDAIGIRQELSKHAQYINQQNSHRHHPLLNTQIGHSPIEIIAGILIGISSSILFVSAVL